MNGHSRLDFTTHGSGDDLSSLDASLRHVDMRKRVEANKCIGSGNSGSRVVAVQILRHNDWTIRAEVFAKRFNDVAITVIDPVNHHRSVQVEQRSIDRAA
jgi:hypothetical protein